MMLSINDTISGICEALSLSLLHSLWQGGIAALLVFLVSGFFKKETASRRYVLYTVILFLFFASNAFVFVYHLPDSVPSNTSEKITRIVSSYSLSSQETILESLLNFCKAYCVPIAAIWLAVVGFKMAQAGSSLLYIRQLKRKGVTEVEEQWLSTVQNLARQMGINRTIRFVQSQFVTVPVVIGTLKPWLLVPLSFFTGLSAAEAEAVLIHELAHIRRRDFLVNILQSFLEAFYFFNPFVYFISKKIREEREYCCDDAAVEVSGGKMELINALIFFRQKTDAQYVIGLSDGKGKLYKRIHRLLYSSQPKTHYMKPIQIITGLILLLSLAFVSFVKPVSPASNKPPMQSEVISFPSVSTLVNDSKPFVTEKKTANQTDKNKAVKDTIPKNASKDFIAGYMAGLNYQKKMDSLQEYAILEQSLLEQKQNKDLSYHQLLVQVQDSLTRQNLEEKRLLEEVVISQQRQHPENYQRKLIELQDNLLYQYQQQKEGVKKPSRKNQP